MQVVIKLLFLFTVLLVFQACYNTEIPEETNDILRELIGTGNKKVLLNRTLADNLENEFRIPLTLEQLKEPPYFSDYRPNIESVITESDIHSWNKKIDQYRPGLFSMDHVESIPTYDHVSERIFNSDLDLSEFDSFATVSIPFLNSLQDKAVIYIEFFPDPEALYLKNSFLIIMKKQDGIWNEIYRKLLVISTP